MRDAPTHQTPKHSTYYLHAPISTVKVLGALLLNNVCKLAERFRASHSVAHDLQEISEEGLNVALMLTCARA